MKPALLKYLQSLGLAGDKPTEAEVKAFMAALKDDQKEVAEALARGGDATAEAEKLAARKAAEDAAAKKAAEEATAPEAEKVAAKMAKTAAAEAVTAERKRAEAIQTLAREHNLDGDWTQRMVSAGRTVEEAKTLAEELTRQVQRFQPVHVAPGSGHPAAAQVLACAALMANGENVRDDFLSQHYSADVLTEAHKRRRISLKGLIAAACALDGRPAPLHDDGPAEWLAAGFSTASLPGILGDSANKSLLEGYASIPAVVPIFFGRRTVTNFREYTEYRMTGDETFDLVAPGGEIHHGALGEEHQHFQAATYGKMFTIDRTMIVNDDLGAFLQIPRRFGRGASMTREKAGMKLIMDNTGSFFVAGHKNLSIGGGSALGAAGLGAAVQKLIEQTDDAAGKNPVLLEPKLILVPPALKGTADDLFTLQVITSNVTNKYRGLYAPHCSPYLGNTTFHASASSAYWWLFADPANAAAFLVAYLNGVETPVIEEVPAAANILGTVWRAYYDFGVTQGDYRAAVRSNGA